MTAAQPVQQTVEAAGALAPHGPVEWSDPLVAPSAVSADHWLALTACAGEANAFVDAHYLAALLPALGDQRPSLLAPRRDGRVVALAPVAWALKARGIPIPALVTPQPYLPLGTPLLDGEAAGEAAAALLDEARQAGALALLLDKVPLGGAAMTALRSVATDRRLTLKLSHRHERAALACVGDAEEYLRASVGGKKLKEYRRLGKRLADEGAVDTVIASTPETIVPLLEDFLSLEAAGWKGARGTGLAQTPGHAAFIRRAAPLMAAEGKCEIIAITLDGRAIAAGLVLYQRDTALFFKIAYDESLARFSPGVQLTLELTRHLFARPDIRFADSTADADHPMINHIWRERLAIADVAIATRRSVVARMVVSAALGRDALRSRAKAALHRFTSHPRRSPETPS